jgi:hypothetical protein
MNWLIVACVTCCVIAVISFVLFHIYCGVTDTLTNARIGGVYNFEYEQPVSGDPERFMAKVISVHRLSNDSIHRLNRTSHYRKHDNQFVRTNHLVTAQTPDGRIRNFYAERTRNVRRPLLGVALFKSGLAAMIF